MATFCYSAHQVIGKAKTYKPEDIVATGHHPTLTGVSGRVYTSCVGC